MDCVALIAGPWTSCCTVAIFLMKLDELLVNRGGLASGSAWHCLFAGAASNLSWAQTAMACLVPLELNSKPVMAWPREGGCGTVAIPLTRLDDL